MAEYQIEMDFEIGSRTESGFDCRFENETESKMRSRTDLRTGPEMLVKNPEGGRECRK